MEFGYVNPPIKNRLDEKHAFTCWDFIEIKGSKTLQDIIDHLESTYLINVGSIVYQSTTLYRKEAPKRELGRKLHPKLMVNFKAMEFPTTNYQKNLESNPESLLKEKKSVGEDRYLVLKAIVSKEGNCDVKFPPIKYYL